jgi:hypothetical protein
MNRKTKFYFILLLTLCFIFLSSVIFAQDNDNDDNNSNNDFDEDDLFGGNDDDNMIEEIDTNDYQEDITQQEENDDFTIDIRGMFYTGAESHIGRPLEDEEAFERSSFMIPAGFYIYLDFQLDMLSIQTEFNFDYNPEYYDPLIDAWNPSFYSFGMNGILNARLSNLRGYFEYEFEHIPEYYNKYTDETILTSTSLLIDELFLDINAGYKAFFRIGKQSVKWGAGYRWSPSDTVNSEKIDPLDPEDDDRTGLNGFKMTVPFYGFSFISFVKTDSLEGLLYPAINLRLEYAYEFFEVGITAYYERDKRSVFAFDGTMGQEFAGFVWDFWTDMSFSMGSNRLFIGYDENALLPMDKYYTYNADNETLFYKAVGGMSTTKSNVSGFLSNLFSSATVSLEYYYNGEGYEDADLIPYMIMIQANQGVKVFEPFETGVHYLGGSAILKDLFKIDDLSFTIIHIHNLTDFSSVNTFSLAYTGVDDLNVEIMLNYYRGDEGTEFYFLSYATTTTFLQNLAFNLDPFTGEITGYDGVISEMFTLTIDVEISF